jgi:hypothetical protein
MSNKQVVVEAITGLFIRRDASVLDTHFAPDYRQHNPFTRPVPAGSGRDLPATE